MENTKENNKNANGRSQENIKVDVKINNMEYTIVSNEPEEYVQRVGLMVNKKVSEVKAQNSRLSTAMLAIMASMNIADELLKCEDSLAGLRGEVSAYMEEAQRNGDELERKKLEVEGLKEDLHKLEIELAKRDTEIENLRSQASQKQSTGGYTRTAAIPVSGQTSFDSAAESRGSSPVQPGRYTSAADRYRK